jgi:hypothetical protein
VRDADREDYILVSAPDRMSSTSTFHSSLFNTAPSSAANAAGHLAQGPDRNCRQFLDGMTWQDETVAEAVPTLRSDEVGT